MKALLWIGILLYAFLTPSYAEEVSCVQDQVKTVIFFGNGIKNTKQEAANSAIELSIRLLHRLPHDQFKSLDFKIAFNHSHGVLLDLFESVKQKVGGDTYVDSYWRWMSNIDQMPDWLQDLAKERLAAIDQTTLVSDGDLANHLAMYRSKILEGKKVLVVAHSQGNLFANAAYNTLYNGTNRITSQSFGIVSVANPASFVGGGGPYTTLSNDVVILAVRALAVAPVVPPLLSNVTNAERSQDPLNHNFLNAYLPTGSISEAKILGDIDTMIATLEQPPARAQDGIITVTLTWGAQPDVDLHAFEPNGIHVYYSNRHGQSGMLDVDDVTGYGPEHYTVNCSALETGTYHIGVNYYDGYGPETALVQIKAGLSIQSFSVPLTTARHSAGNATPISVADIVVNGDSTAGFAFDIRSTYQTATPITPHYGAF